MEQSLVSQSTLLLMIVTISSSWAWYLEARPSIKYITPGGRSTVTCYNISSTNTLPHNTRWYKVAPNSILEQIPTGVNERVRSDGSQLRISSATNEDNGTYCCKGPTQALDTCDETATAHLIVVALPVIAPGQNQTGYVGRNATLECVVEDVGNPPFSVARWQKSGQRLVMDETKYTSRLVGNRMFLTIINTTTDDEGYYQCVLETPAFQRTEASVHLSVNHSITHTGISNVLIPNTTYSLQIHGQNEISIGMNLTIQCMVTTSGGSSANNNEIQLSLALPTGGVIVEREFSAVATLEHSGTYSCIAFLNGAPTVVSLPVSVYAAPQPTFHAAVLSASYGANISLPCNVDTAHPRPSYYWEKLSEEDISSEINGEMHSDGSLLLQNVRKSGLYRCIANNVYGSSVQVTDLRVEMSSDIKQQSLELIGAHLWSSCNQAEHRMALSSVLEQYITSICNCGDITVDISVKSCNNDRAVYSIQLNGVMVTEAALLLLTKMQNFTEGLDLGIVVLFLQEQGNRLESHCDDKSKSFSAIISIIVVLTVIIAIILTLILIFAIYFKKRAARESQNDGIKEAVNSDAYYITPNSLPPLYSHLSHFDSAPPVPIRRSSNSDKSLPQYKEVYPKSQSNNVKPYLEISFGDIANNSPPIHHNPAYQKWEQK